MKNELIIGIAGSLLVLALTIMYGGKYLAQQQKLSSLRQGSESQTAQPTEGAGAKLTAEEVAKHNNQTDCWFIISGAVYDVTKYVNIHPGGANRIIESCGTDATQAFMTQGGRGQHSQDEVNALKLFYIGDLNGSVTAQPDTQKIQQLPVRQGSDDDD